MKLCDCGCGLPAPIAPKSEARRGYIKGEPLRYRKGHRSASADHRRRVAGTGSLVTRHRLRAEKALGKPLPTKAVVHHADGSRRDDAPLVICQDNVYHQLLHARMRVKAAGGDPNRHRICGKCRIVTELDKMQGGWCCYCRRASSKERYLKRKAKRQHGPEATA